MYTLLSITALCAAPYLCSAIALSNSASAEEPSAFISDATDEKYKRISNTEGYSSVTPKYTRFPTKRM